MTTAAKPMLGASPPEERWNAIDWRTSERQVLRLQMRIAKATREGRWGKIKSLQWLLTHSFAAKLLAVRRVTQNAGRNTAGVDGIVWKTAARKHKAARSLQRRSYQTLPLRRIYIPKKNGKLRPLGIPAISCRAMQALHLQALEPIAETLADPNSYGFRPKRSTADAIGQCFNALSSKHSAEWIFEGDISACFDRLDHTWLQDHIPMDKLILGKWLAAGYMEEGIVFPTDAGSPQGGIASPTLANMALDGLESVAHKAAPRNQKINVIRYADDFVITGASKEVLETRIKPAVVAFLKERGLELSEEKTRITHIEEGFDFLGFNVRKYAGKMFIKPSKVAVKRFLDDIRELIKAGGTDKTEQLIRQLNLKLRGWANYYRHVVAKRTFNFVDDQVFEHCGPGPNDGTQTNLHGGGRIGTSDTSDCGNGCSSPKSGTSSDSSLAWSYSLRQVYPSSVTLRFKLVQRPMIRRTPTISRIERAVVVRLDRQHKFDVFQTYRRSRRRVLYPRTFVRLEPYVGKLASTVLRGG